MKINSNLLIAPLIAATLVLSACDSDDDASEMDVVVDESGENMGADGTETDGTDADGTETDGTETDGSDADGTETDGTETDGTDPDGTETNGTETDGTEANGTETDGAETDDASASRAVVVSVASDFSSSVVDLIDAADPYALEGELHPGVSDTFVRAYEDNYYVIRAFESDSIAAYSSSDSSTALYELSTNGDDEPEVSSNPHDLVFLSAEKAYLVRYGSPLVWIVNPSATDPSEFRIGEIDLSAYDADGVPNATRGVIVGDKLYVVMQRLDGFAPTQTGYVAVIDTNTDTEIDTGTGTLPGVELPLFNPGEVSVDTTTDTLFISAFGDFGGFTAAELTGGVATLDTTDYSTNLVVDDGEGTGRILNVEVVAADNGYLITSSGFGINSLDQFNPITGRIDALGVAGLSGVDVRDFAVGPQGNLWVGVGDASSPKVMVINPTDNSVVTEIVTTQNPDSIAFVR